MRLICARFVKARLGLGFGPPGSGSAIFLLVSPVAGPAPAAFGLGPQRVGLVCWQRGPAAVAGLRGREASGRTPAQPTTKAPAKEDAAS
jgi:hypothetical protein